MSDEQLKSQHLWKAIEKSGGQWLGKALLDDIRRLQAERNQWRNRTHKFQTALSGAGKDILRLEGEVEEQRCTIEILANGLGPGYSGWKRCALRLRAEILRLDPTNRTESQIDWRIQDEGEPTDV